MEGIKLLFLTLLGLDVIQQAAGACSSTQVQTCRDALDDDIGFNFQTRLPVPPIIKANLPGFCTGIKTFTECLDNCERGGDTVTTFNYEPYEAIGEFICDDQDLYTDLYDQTGDSTRQLAWRVCFDASGLENLDGDETASTTCKKLETFVDCVVEEVEDNHVAARYYIRAMAHKALGVFDDHYNCDLNTLSAGWIIGIVFGSIAGLILIGAIVFVAYKFFIGQSFGGGYGPQGPPPPPRPRPYGRPRF